MEDVAPPPFLQLRRCSRSLASLTDINSHTAELPICDLSAKAALDGRPQCASSKRS